MRKRLVALLFVAVSAGCGDDDDGPSGCGDCGAYEEVLGATCDLIDRCPDAIYPIAYRDRGECIAILYFLFTCRLTETEVGDDEIYGVEQVVVEVDPAEAQACAEWLAAADCEVLSGEGDSAGSPCDGIFGAIAGDGDDPYGAAEGESCESESCREGLWCTPATLDEVAGTVSCQLCQALPGDGASCAESGTCADGLYCRWDMAGATCRPLVADGGACTGNNNECATGFCNPNTMACDPGGNEGDPCGMTSDCRWGAFCAGTCTPLRQNGGPCADDTQCVYTNCDEPTGTCGLPLGATCSSDWYCATGWCGPGATGDVCQARKADGSPCSEHVECQSEYCDYSSGLCLDRCYGDEDCADGELCSWDTQRCEPLRADGEYCQDEEECLSGWCNDSSQCAARPGVGDPCSGWGDCTPLGYCGPEGTCVAKHGPFEACEALDSCQEPYLCVEGHCRLMMLECRPATAGEMCTWLRVCDEASYCDLYDGFRCKARAGIGGSCSSTDQCVADAYCYYDPMFGTQQCRPRGAAGAVCASADECGPGLYCIGATYGTPGACGAGPEGQPCDDYDAPCPDGYFCDDGLCAPPHPLGEDCWYGEPCEAGLYCDISDGCQPMPGVGGACDSNIPCDDGLYCGSSNTCVPEVGAGQECSPYYPVVECAAGLYCNDDVYPYVCAALLGSGADCYEDEVCQSGACWSGYGCLSAAECVP